MASTKISQLTALGATPADDDVLAIVDTSDSSTKKVTVANLVAAGFDANASRVTIGLNASSQGSGGTDFYNIAIGDSASAIGTAGIAIGRQASVANGVDNAVAIGISSDVGQYGNGAVAIGRNAAVNGTDQIAIGNDSGSTGYNADTIAIGPNAGSTNQGTGSIAIGKTANSVGSFGIAVGADSDATRLYSMALGHNAQATASNGDIAIGKDATTVGAGASALAVGYSSSAAGSYSVSIGYDAGTDGAQGVAVGYIARAQGADSVAIGRQLTTSGYQAIGIGYGASAAGDGAVAIGKSAGSAGNYGIAIGQLSGADAANTIHISSAASATNQPQTAGYMVIESDDAKLSYEGSWQFDIGGSELARIDSSGNLLVGTTNSNPVSGNVVGTAILSDGTFLMTRDGGTPAFFNRKTSDGTLVDFRKDGNTVGGTGCKDGDLFIHTGTTGLRFVDGGNSIRPVTSNGNIRDNAIDLGGTTSRFKDLYLSGGISFNPNASTNKLDDYEEGTWTPVIADASSGGNTATATSLAGHYTKVGRLVTISFYAVNIDTTGMTSGNDLFFRGLPFNTSSVTNQAVQVGSCRADNFTFTGNYIAPETNVTGVDRFVIKEIDSGAADQNLTVSSILSGTADLFLSLTYVTS